MTSESDSRSGQFLDANNSQNVIGQHILKIYAQSQSHDNSITQIVKYLDTQQAQLNQIMHILNQMEKNQIEPLILNSQHYQANLDQIQQNQKKFEQLFLQQQQLQLQQQQQQHQQQQQQQQQSKSIYFF